MSAHASAGGSFDAVSKLIEWREDPVQFVEECFQASPDLWQADALRDYQRVPKLALSACKGPGKSCVLSWIAWHFLLTRRAPKILCTSISSDNLRDNLWAEMAYWQARSPLLMASFDIQAQTIRRTDDPQIAFMSLRTWSRSASEQEVAKTLAGLHGDETLVLVDESGGIPPAVLREAEGSLSTEADNHIVQAGNPISRDGALFTACRRHRDSWRVIEITGDPDDPKRSPRVSIKYAREQIAELGREHPWVQSNILGKFPTQSLDTLITEDEVRDAMARKRRDDEVGHAPLIFGVDTARFGIDKSVIFPRRGLIAYSPAWFRGLDTQRGLAILARKVIDEKPDAVFIDDTGGYGAGYVDGMRTMGHSVIGVHFSNTPSDPRYQNKRAEIYFLATQWIKQGGTLPPEEDLVAELCEPQYMVHPTTGKFIIEDKDAVKARIGRSPDFADALCLTFSMPVSPARQFRPQKLKYEYNPYGEFMKTADSRRSGW